MNERVRYQELVFDSLRWEGFEFRDGDIVISTPPKCGTTWTQMLVALLVFDGPDLYAPMDGISPWLDMQTRSKEEVHALLAAQAHRRFIKTHTPLDGVPVDDRVTYLIVGRDPRDVAVSFQHHLANMDFDEFLKAREAAVGNDDLEEFAPMEPLPEEPNERIRQFIESDTFVSMSGILHHLHVGWQHRDRENVHLFHYSDYSRDLPGSLQQIATAIGAPISGRRAAELAAEASLDRMRDRAREVAPDMMHNHWKDPSAFFRSGGSGEWRENLSPETLQDYEQRSRESFRDTDFWSGHTETPRPDTHCVAKSPECTCHALLSHCLRLPSFPAVPRRRTQLEIGDDWLFAAASHDAASSSGSCGRFRLCNGARGGDLSRAMAADRSTGNQGPGGDQLQVDQNRHDQCRCDVA